MADSGKIVVFADDITGALDVAGSFHSTGLDTVVKINREADDLDDRCIVWALNSRYLSARESAEEIASVHQLATANNRELRVFLKMDSTLRGNVISDSRTLSELVPGRPVFIAPAFPFHDRTCIEGVYYVKGQRIDATEYASDSAYNYSSYFLNDGASDIRHVDWRTLHKGVEAVIEEVDSSPHQLYTFDARNQTDLEIIANAGHRLSASMVGSSGMARAFPEERSDTATGFTIDSSLPTLFVIGSINQASRAQKEELSQYGVVGFDLSRKSIGNVGELSKIRKLVEERLDVGGAAYIATPDEVILDESLSTKIENSIGYVCNIRQTRHNIVVAGGETAKAVLTWRGIKSLIVRSEYKPGIPITTEPRGQEAIITKAGGFGYSDTLADIHRYMAQ